ncbi:hypothetical protein PFICI_11938 [Pestalotiopsis fici W106-1]|uniref:Alpha/beta hydrolase fold-3 domain-containing protein n=1 Tax=Pestalotiopsis fici (strain W106-1 / CGMCC3.15140) TaxID=1229662 RepID=W3WUK7_PESFW|nr:uncharacterized protein PFICI_11938 [Pestalotiopsis fici W106-1]ETS76551.1 hypothetical protein PFICI_11938 [Pestalotiopsis fici W106-1]
MSTIWAKHPFKALYAAYIVTETIAILPWLFLRYMPRAARPSPSWSIKICVITALLRQLLRYHGKTQSTSMSTVLSDHKKHRDRFALAQPADVDLYSGVLTPGATQPAAVGGLWHPAPLFPGSPNIEDEKVVLHLPGGAFVMAFGTDENTQNISRAMTKHLKATRTFVAQYRVSVDAGTRFPAALQDGVTFYHYILSLGVRPENVILSGDSAAGNLVIGMLRYLESSSKLPLPGGAMVWSPWVQVTPQAAADLAGYPNERFDMLPGSLLQWGADAYFPGTQPSAEQLAYISPLHRPFKTSVPLFIHACAAEALFHVDQEFAREMAKIESNRVKFHVTEMGSHDLIIGYTGFGMENEIGSAIEDADKLFRQK